MSSTTDRNFYALVTSRHSCPSMAEAQYLPAAFNIISYKCETKCRTYHQLNGILAHRLHKVRRNEYLDDHPFDLYRILRVYPCADGAPRLSDARHLGLCPLTHQYYQPVFTTCLSGVCHVYVCPCPLWPPPFAAYHPGISAASAGCLALNQIRGRMRKTGTILGPGES